MTGKHMESTELEFRCPIYTTLPLVKPVAWLARALSTDVAVLLLNQPIIIDRAYRWEVEQHFHWNFLVKFNCFLGFFSGRFVCIGIGLIQTWCERPFSTAQVTCRCQNCQITKDDGQKKWAVKVWMGHRLWLSNLHNHTNHGWQMHFHLTLWYKTP